MSSSELARAKQWQGEVLPTDEHLADTGRVIEILSENLVQGLFIDPNDVINMYAKIEIPQGAPITSAAISAVPGNVSLPGSSWANSIPQGLTAMKWRG